MKNDTLTYLKRRAVESGLDPAVLCLQLTGEEKSGFDFYVTVAGALDEDFMTGPTIYEVSIADWLAEDLREYTQKDGDDDWSVEVYQWPRHEGDNPLYRVV